MEQKKSAPKTPAQRIQEMLKGWVKDFSKTPYIYPVSLAIAGGVYYLTLLYLSSICFVNLLPPLVLLGLLWMFNVKSVKRLALVGLVAFLLFSGVWMVAYTQFYTGAQPEVCVSEDGVTLTNGTVEPFRGGGGQVYNFTLDVHYNVTGTPVYYKNVTLLLREVSFPGYTDTNETMTLLNNNTVTQTWTYYYSAEISTAINQFAFFVEYPNNSTLLIAGVWSVGGASLAPGPYKADNAAIILAILPFSFFQTLLNVLLVYLLIIGMIWWTRRARRMREQQVEKWQKEQAEKEAAQPKSTQLKVPSLAKATGKEKGGGETFVCSECGADVPADATVCPNCGEKFD